MTQEEKIDRFHEIVNEMQIFMLRKTLIMETALVNFITI